MSAPIFVRFWGTRGSIPTPGHKTRRYGGNTSCVEIRSGETELVCDGGTGLRELGLDLGAEIRTRHFEAEAARVDDFQVRCFEQAHPGRSFGYAFELGGKKIVYATDSELDRLLVNRDETERAPEKLRRLPPELVACVAGADLLIADGQYTDAEYPKKAGWGHARANTVADLAHQAGVKQCAVFHHDPLHSDELVDRKIALAKARLEAHGSSTLLFGAREGLELRF